MSFYETQLVPFYDNNYFFILINKMKGHALLVDPGDFSEIRKILISQNLKLTGVLLTHYHSDHAGGLEEIKKMDPTLPIYGGISKSPYFSNVNSILRDGDIFSWEDLQFQVYLAQGHTQDHLIYYEPNLKWLFCGDVLFGLGCGRLFEGTPEDMMKSLSWIKQKDDQTLVYCAHEYTLVNAEFVKANEQFWPAKMDRKLFEQYVKTVQMQRLNQIPSVPLDLGLQKKINPFLVETDLKLWTEWRLRRNQF